MTGDINTLLNQAQERAEDEGLPYAGAFTPEEAHTFLKNAPGAQLVDVRTRAERDWVGYVPGSIHIEWQSYPSMQPHPDFIQALETAKVDPAKPVLFLCRSGGRSHAAAALAAANGFEQAFNVLEGFEGDKNQEQRRSQVNGWKHASLPWVQS